MKKQLVKMTLAAGIAALGSSSYAIDIDAGDYTALPEGTNVGLVYYQHAERNTLQSNGNQVAGNNGLNSDIAILRLIHFTKIGDYVVDPQVLLPTGRLNATGDLSAPLGSATGTADAIFAATVWTLNDPVNRRYFGITPFVYAPTGNYDASKGAMNLGENRWKYALQTAYIHGLGDKWTLDLAADVTSYGTNDNFQGKSKTQANTTQLQGFLRYALTPTWDLRAGVSKTHVGSTSLNGVNQSDSADITKVQLGSAMFIDQKTQILATWGQDTKVDNGFKENARLNLRLLRVF